MPTTAVSITGGAAVRLWAHWIPAKIRIQSVDFDSRFITLDPPYAGSLKGTVYGNLIAQTMSGGVRFVGGSNRDNIIENNCVHHVGEGIYVRNSVGDVIRHNLIHDVESNGFKSLYVERQTISYNDISRVGLDGTDSDAGGIYTNCTAGGPEGGHVTIDHNHATNGNRILEIDMPPCIACVLLNVSCSVAVRVVASFVVGEACGK